MGKCLDLKNPKTYTEKLQWLKLYNRKPEYTTMVDKYEVKEYVAGIIGEEYIIPTLGVWDKPEQIEWDKLPDQFVLKTTHGGGGSGIVICRDKTTFDKKKAIDKLNQSLKSDIYHTLREWPYKNVRKRIIAEKYMEDFGIAGKEDLVDYKFFCFGGEPKYIQVIQDRRSNETIDFFDLEWNHQEFVGLNPTGGPMFGSAAVMPAKPNNLDTMIRIARELAKDIDFARVDLYEINGREYFGEITFYPASGFGNFTPDNWNDKLGAMLNLPEINGGGYKILIESGIKIEKLNKNELKDYKFYCFGGEPKVMLVASNRFTTHNFDYFDMDFNRLPIQSAVGKVTDAEYEKPECFEEMKDIARKLSEGLAHIRVDLYCSNGKVYFGELTFFDASGYDDMSSDYWNTLWGSWIELPNE